MMKKSLLLLAFAFLPMNVGAASASLVLDTGNVSVNTLEATITLPVGGSVTHIDDGDSTVIIWISQPKFDPATHSITFAGLTPGGFTGSHTVFAFTGDFKDSDIGLMKVSNVTALKNDGKGTAANVKLTLKSVDVASDQGPPEAVTMSVQKTPSVFDGDYFLSFLTQDKQSGIDHYEYAATTFISPKESAWQKVESPYQLGKSDLTKKLYIRAVDNAGNTRISSISGPNRNSWLSLWGIILGLIVCVLYYVRRLFFV